MKKIKRSRKTMYLSFDEWNVWFHSHGTPFEKWSVAPPQLEDIYNFEDALVVGCLMMTLLRHCDRVKMACLAQLVNVIAPIMTENAENGGRCWAQTIFYPFMYMSQYGRGKVLDTRVECETYSTDRVKAVPYVESLAVLHEDTNELDIFAVNRSLEEASEFTFDLSAFTGNPEIIEHVVLYHDDLKAINTAEKPDNVVPEASGDASANGTAIKATLGKQSWNMIRVKL